uniref:Uncharacterized protein n=1 Tax=Aegilops tauschii subsp. strangulata TaxID=200361 RepID=A0A453B5F0_AEGTS
RSSTQWRANITSQRSAPTHTPRKRPFELHSAWFPPRTPAAPRFFSWPCCCSRAPAWAARHGAWRRQRLRTITRARRRSRRLRTITPPRRRSRRRSTSCCRRSRGSRRSRKSSCRPCPRCLRFPGSAPPSPSRRPISHDQGRGP